MACRIRIWSLNNNERNGIVRQDALDAALAPGARAADVDAAFGDVGELWASGRVPPCALLFF